VNIVLRENNNIPTGFKPPNQRNENVSFEKIRTKNFTHGGATIEQKMF